MFGFSSKPPSRDPVNMVIDLTQESDSEDHPPQKAQVSL